MAIFTSGEINVAGVVLAGMVVLWLASAVCVLVSWRRARGAPRDGADQGGVKPL